MKSIKILTGILWVFIIGSIFYGHFIKGVVPQNIIDLVKQYPISIYSTISQFIFLSLISIFMVGLYVNQTRYQKLLLILAICFRLLQLLFVDISFEFPGAGFVEDMISILLGAIFILSAKDRRLYTQKYLRLAAVGLILSFAVVYLVSYLTDARIPIEFNQYLRNTNSDIISSLLFGSVEIILAAGFFVGAIGIFFRSLIAKYIFAVSSILLYSIGITHADGLTGVNSIVCALHDMFIGITLALLFATPAGSQLKINRERVKRLNIFRTAYYSFYSKKFYQEVATEWKGAGLSFYLLFSIGFAIITCSGVMRNYYSVDFIKDKEITKAISQLPDLHISSGKISTERPVLIVDDHRNPVIFINTNSKVSKLDPRIKIYISGNNIIVNNKGHINLKNPSQQFINHVAIKYSKMNLITHKNFPLFIQYLKQLTFLNFPQSTIYGYVLWCLIIFSVAAVSNYMKKMRGRNHGLKLCMRMYFVSMLPYQITYYFLSYFNIYNLFFLLILLVGKKLIGASAPAYFKNLDSTQLKSSQGDENSSNSPKEISS